MPRNGSPETRRGCGKGRGGTWRCIPEWPGSGQTSDAYLTPLVPGWWGGKTPDDERMRGKEMFVFKGREDGNVRAGI